MRWRKVAAIGLAALIGGAIAATFAAPAMASTVPLSLDFGVVMPGQTYTASKQFTIDRAATVSATEWTHRTGPADTVWTVHLCSTSGCTPLADLAGQHIAAGEYSVSVSVRLSASVQTETSLTGNAVIRLVAFDDEMGLAATGGSSPWLLVTGGALLCGIGALVLTRSRRERAT